MQGANGDALEWAMALLQAPGERHVLRVRPLPEGITALLAIAAGAAPDALATAAQRFFEPPARVQEAAQFYVREILLYPDADAYRVMGVKADADRELIKAHHRLLQRWLHPDRLQHAADGVFASRVNAAWQQLRNPDLRARYDAQLHLVGGAGQTGEAGTGQLSHVWVTETPPVPARQRWLRRLPLLLLLLLCAGLSWRIWQEQSPGSALIEEEAMLAAKVETRQPDAPPTPRAANRSPVPAGRSRSTQTVQAPSPRLQPQRLTALQSARLAQVPTSPPPAPSAMPLPQAQGKRVLDVTLPLPLPAAPAEIPVATVVDRVPVPVVAASPAPPSAPVTMPNEAQLRAAQQTGEQLLRYMQQASRPSPPIWNSPGIQSSAEQLRTSLLANGPLRLGPARWRIGTATADLAARFPAQGASNRGGVFTAALQWREGRWWVTGVGMEQVQ